MSKPKQFPRGKTAKQLGIDTKRKFVVVGHFKLPDGAMVELASQKEKYKLEDLRPLFKTPHGLWHIEWRYLAYAPLVKSSVDLIAESICRWQNKRDALTPRGEKMVRALSRRIAKKLGV